MVRQANRDPSMGPKKCTICNARLISPRVVATHVKGQRHQALLAELQAQGRPPKPEDIIIEDADRNYECLICEMTVWQTKEKHELTPTHKRKERFLSIRSALEEAEKDKNGISVYPDGKDAFNFGLKPAGHARLEFHVTYEVAPHRVYLDSARMASDSHRNNNSGFSVSMARQYIMPKIKAKGVITFESQGSLGRFQDRLELVFLDVVDRKKFAIVKPLLVIVGSQEDYDLLKPIAPYVPAARRKRETVQELVESTPPPAISRIQWTVRLLEYELQKGLKTILDTPSKEEKMRLLKSGFIPRTFSPQTHARLFHILLYIEEHQSAIDLERYDQEDVSLDPAPREDLYYLEVPGLAEKRPSVIIGDRILVKHHGSPKPHWWEGFVYKIRLNDVGLRFNNKFNAFKGQRFDVRFCLNRLTLRRMHQALDSGGLCERLLFPSEEHIQNRKPSPGTIQTLNMVNRNISTNPAQSLAVTAIRNLSPGSPPFVVFGPPGTGKTVTIVEAIRQILLEYPTARVLACAPSNSASDIIAERLIALGSDLFRLNAPSRPVDHLPKSLLPFSLVERDVFAVPELARLKRYRVIVSTCLSASVPFGIGVQAGHFSHVFVDEAGQACEPEALIPFKTMADAKTNLILSGDPKQLGPIVRANAAIALKLGVSLLDRLTEMPIYDERAKNGITIVKLVNNFRSHPDILRFPNQRFYRGELESKGDPIVIESMLRWPHLPQSGFPIIFHAMAGKDLREARSPSFFNVEEVMQVKKYVQMLFEDKKYRLTEEHIGIISPYHAQCGKIRLALLKEGYTRIKIGSVEEFQGQERRVMIISTVRSNLEFVQSDITHTLGFVANPRRFNVAMTRAEALLIVVGDPNILSLDPLWRSFLNFIYNNGGWAGRPRPDWDTHAELDSKEFLEARRAKANAEEQEMLTRITETVVDHINADDLDDIGDGYEAVERPWRETE
ncbi:Probable RNA helicase SDE3; AltName: Full=Silencing defective protein 3 [Serendipita indica DSM 11827]|nr:Probable RNA helicase SDE3; AltName: Full=Silencing defective protein 3 [Serendipita indica DSM 11827]